VLAYIEAKQTQSKKISRHDLTFYHTFRHK